MTKLEIAQKVLISTGGIAKTADFIAAGLAKYDVCNLNHDEPVFQRRSSQGGNRIGTRQEGIRQASGIARGARQA